MSIYIPLIFSVTVGAPGAPLPLPSVAPYLHPVSYQSAADPRLELRRADLNRDGRVTFEEADEQARCDFVSADRNRDQLLSRREFRDGDRAFYFEDTDRDGRLTYYEHEAAARARFIQLDDNRDGLLAGPELGWAPRPRQYSPGWW
jgi:Ca2+-binding EF-hand superfamily protein